MRCILSSCLPLAIIGWSFSAMASEYEVEGKIKQEIVQPDGKMQKLTNDFTIFVRNCGWLIQITEDDGRGNIVQRQIGCTNGIETIEIAVPLKYKDPSKTSDGDQTVSPNLTAHANGIRRNSAIIRSSAVPVGNLDTSVYGHIWLMFASQCYFKDMHANRLTPIYDWHATVGGNPGMKVLAKWDLLGEQGSLPEQVCYLGEWDETNGFYRATGSKEVGGVLIPNGFVFEERHAQHQQMVLRKRVEAEVTSVRPVCSKKELFPEANDRVVVTDFRLPETMPPAGIASANSMQGSKSLVKSDAGHIPTYTMDFRGEWPTVDEAKQIIDKKNHPKQSLRQSSPLWVAVICALLAAPLAVFWLKTRKSARRP